MDRDTLWGHIDRERARLADVLDVLTEDQWRTPSLCSGWTVRDVGAHLTMAQSRLRDVWRPMVRARFDYNTMVRESALALPIATAEIGPTLRGFVGSRRTAPFISDREPLIDILVHSQDICVPLGIDHPMPADAAVEAVDRMVVLNRIKPIRLRPPLRGVRLVATDAEWSTGDGTTVTGPMTALVMLLAGRDSVALPRLQGDLAALAA
jgi:uncharacterized protein (TIGR03083 family)